MKPMIRGYITQAAFIIALIACAMLIYHSQGARALTANIIYSFSLIGMYCVSSLYHSHTWNHQNYLLLKRIDHATIFVLIAGTTTPICLLSLQGNAGWLLLSISWLIAVIGIFKTIFWTHGPKWIRTLLYIMMGWVAIFFLPELKASLGLENMWLIITGGILYTLGALIYAFKHPNPFPKIFGYHELFHVFVVTASACHFFVIYNL